MPGARRAHKGIAERRIALQERLCAWRDEMWLQEWSSLGMDGFMGKEYFLPESVISDVTSRLGVIEWQLQEGKAFVLTDHVLGILPEVTVLQLPNEIRQSIATMARQQLQRSAN